MSQNEALVSRQPTTTTEEPATRSDEDDALAAEETTSEGEAELPLDIIFELLKNQRRRHLLAYLKDEDGQVELGELAEHVAALENDTTVNALTSGQRKRVYVGLYQCHLPKMDDAGVIDFNRDRGIIELNESATQLEKYLEEPGIDGRAWHSYYLGVALGGAALYGSSYAVFSPSHPITSAAVLVLLVAVVACSLAHHAELTRTPE